MKGEVLSHWYTMVENFSTSTRDFYAVIERDFAEREVPGLKMARVTFSESGWFSADRLYLRMKRERLVFDICAAPFGTSYFFSMRFAELPHGLPWWRWIPVVYGACLVWDVLQNHREAPMIKVLSIIIVVLLVGVVILGMKIIENQLRKESYYRQDTRLMYLEIVNAVVKQRVAEVTSAGGFQLLDIRQHSPILDELYKTTQLRIERVEPAPAPESLPA